jgi:ABC-2 type transport system permease protein
VLLKGNSAGDIAPHLWPIAAFMVTMAAIALLRYRRTLD